MSMSIRRNEGEKRRRRKRYLKVVWRGQTNRIDSSWVKRLRTDFYFDRAICLNERFFFFSDNSFQMIFFPKKSFFFNQRLSIFSLDVVKRRFHSKNKIPIDRTSRFSSRWRRSTTISHYFISFFSRLSEKSTMNSLAKRYQMAFLTFIGLFISSGIRFQIEKFSLANLYFLRSRFIGQMSGGFLTRWFPSNDLCSIVESIFILTFWFLLKSFGLFFRNFILFDSFDSICNEKKCYLCDDHSYSSRFSRSKREKTKQKYIEVDLNHFEALISSSLFDIWSLWAPSEEPSRLVMISLTRPVPGFLFGKRFSDIFLSFLHWDIFFYVYDKIFFLFFILWAMVFFFVFRGIFGIICSIYGRYITYKKSSIHRTLNHKNQQISLVESIDGFKYKVISSVSSILKR